MDQDGAGFGSGLSSFAAQEPVPPCTVRHCSRVRKRRGFTVHSTHGVLPFHQRFAWALAWTSGLGQAIDPRLRIFYHAWQSLSFVAYPSSTGICGCLACSLLPKSRPHMCQCGNCLAAVYHAQFHRLDCGKELGSVRLVCRHSRPGWRSREAHFASLVDRRYASAEDLSLKRNVICCPQHCRS